MNDITLKITIDGKEANATIQLTDENIKQLYKSYKLGTDQAGDASASMLRGLTNARDAIGGLKEVSSVLTGIFGTGIQKAHDYELAMAKIEGVIRSNGSAAGYTAEEIDKLSSSFSKSSLFSKADILNAQQVLLTFENIGHDTLPVATEAVMGLAATMGTDMAGAAKTLGMVLENPMEMMRRLRSMGIVLDADQKEHIKTIQEEQGINAAGQVILDILAKKYGEVNAEIQKTDTFKIDQMEKDFGKLQKTAGGMEASIIAPFLNIGSAISSVNPQLGGAAVMIGQVTVALTTLRVTGIMPAFSSMSVFGQSLTSLGGLMASGGILAGVAALTYGLDKLSTAYQTAKTKVEGFSEAYKLWIQINEQNISGMNSKQAQFEIDSQTEALQKLKEKRAEVELAKQYALKQQAGADAKTSPTYVAGFQSTLKAANISAQLYDEQIKTAEAAIQKANERLNTLNKQISDGTVAALRESTTREIDGLKSKADALKPEQIKELEDLRKQIAEKNRLLESLNVTKTVVVKHEKAPENITQRYIDEEKESQRHELAMLQLSGASDEEIKQKKLDHYGEMFDLLIKYGQNTEGTINSISELVAEMDADRDKKQLDQRKAFLAEKQRLNKEAEDLYFAQLKKNQEGEEFLVSLKAGNTSGSFDQQQQEVEIEYQANLKKAESYKQYADIKTQLDIQHTNKLAEIEATKTANTISQTQRAVTSVAGLFGKQTAAYKVLTGATILMEGYKSAQAALSPPPVGLGPVYGWTLIPGVIAETAKNIAGLNSIKGFAKGSTALVGENGPEIIAPLQEYASGQANMVKAVLNAVDYHLQTRPQSEARFSFAAMEKIMSDKLQGFNDALNGLDIKIDKVGLSLAVRAGNDLLRSREV